MTRLLFYLAFLLFFAPSISAQDELLDLLGDAPATTERVRSAFKSPRVINSHSMEMLHKGTLDFRILHRFGEVSGGAYEMFGLDQAAMRMGFDFGITKNLTAGFGRSTAKKEIDGFVKYRLLWQSKGERNIPVSLIWVSGMTINGLRDGVGIDGVETTFTRRLGYYHSLIVGRKFNEAFSLQVSPTLIHNNVTASPSIPNDLYAVGLGGRLKITKRIAFVWDYTYLFNRVPSDINFNPLSVGVDIETGGHVFQLHFSNATGMNERAYITDANGNWTKGDVRFGFNLSRVFQLRKKG